MAIVRQKDASGVAPGPGSMVQSPCGMVHVAAVLAQYTGSMVQEAAVLVECPGCMVQVRV